MTWLAALPLVIVLMAAENPAQPPAANTATGFIDKAVTVDDETYRYSVYVPPTYDPNQPWPAILFLHGSGERGDDGLVQTEVGIGTAIRKRRDRVPAVVIMPQCRRDDVWWSPKMTKMVLAAMNATGREYHLDPNRIYLTGLSLGGGGCWHFGALLSDQLAAIAPICAISDEQMGFKQPLAPKLTGAPIWAYHGVADKRVPVESSRKMAREIKAAGGDIRLIEYPAGTHFIWNRVYEDHEFWRWLFAQRRDAPPQTQPTQDADAE